MSFVIARPMQSWVAQRVQCDEYRRTGARRPHLILHGQRGLRGVAAQRHQPAPRLGGVRGWAEAGAEALCPLRGGLILLRLRQGIHAACHLVRRFGALS